MHVATLGISEKCLGLDPSVSEGLLECSYLILWVFSDVAKE